MPLPSKVLPGFAFAIYSQTAATPIPLTTAQLSALASVSVIAVPGAGLPVQVIPAFGQDDAVASYPLAGSRQGDKIPAQSALSSMTITAAWNPSDANLLLMRSDAYSGTVDRTFVITATPDNGTSIVYFAFNARVGQFQIDAAPGAEAKCMFTLHPRGSQYGWSNNA